MKLSAPSQNLFIVAVVLAVLALLGTIVAIPVVSVYAFWIMAAAFVVLTVGVIARGA